MKYNIYNQIRFIMVVLVILLTQHSALTYISTKITNHAKNILGIYRIPFKFDPILYPVPIIEVSINGSEPRLFALDTGTSDSICIFNWAAKYYHLNDSGRIYYNAPFNNIEHKAVQKYIYVSIQCEQGIIYNKLINNINLIENNGALDFQIDPKTRVAGVIGISFISKDFSAMKIDYDLKILTLYSLIPKSFRNIVSNNSVNILKMKMYGDSLYAVPVKIQDKTFSFIIDTGDNISTISKSDSLEVKHDNSGLFTYYYNEQNIYHLINAQIMPITIGEYNEPNLLIGLSSLTKINTLGENILFRNCFIMDFKNKQLIIRRRKNYDNICRISGVFGVSDIKLKKIGNNYYIKRILIDSPPMSAGLSIGDEIIEVDGHQLNKYTLNTAQNILNGLAGEGTKLTVKMKNKKIKIISYNRDIWYRFTFPNNSNPRLNGLSVNLSMSVNNIYLIIVGIKNNSPASRLGLKVGDVIYKINKINLSNIEINKIISYLLTKGHSISIKRKTRTRSVNVIID